MTKLIPLTTALVLALGLPQVAEAQNGNGNGNGGGRQERSERGDDRRENREERREDRQERREDRQEVRQERREDRRDDRRVEDTVRDAVRAEARDDRQIRREIERRVDPLTRAERVLVRRERYRDVVEGCPPGLAKRDNGCLPPGQERRIARARYDYLWGTQNRDDDFDYKYEDGYLYRMNRQGSLLGYVPDLGGALAQGRVWPQQYGYEPLPTYQRSYFGLNDNNDYRYADGAVYRMDPRTQAISQVAALLTGQQFNVGQPMPAGYDVYNVPYQYRSQYADTAQSQYRYNDGYVYQVDPTTRLVQAVIQLLT